MIIINNNIIDLRENNAIRKIADYYWENCDTANQGSLWEWLATEYGAVNTQEGGIPVWNGGGNSLRVKFDNPAAMTWFRLRWLA